MKKIFLTVSLAGILIFSACKSENKDKSSEEISTEQSQNMPVSMSADSQQTIVSEPSGTVAQPVVNPAAPVSTAKGMNPAHGEPGHRCDIAVGAPLNSPPGQTPAATPTIMSAEPNNSASPTIPVPAGGGVQPQVIQSTPAPSGPTPPGMNPPHGEPGHDCSIAVGAPLKK